LFTRDLDKRGVIGTIAHQGKSARPAESARVGVVASDWS